MKNYPAGSAPATFNGNAKIHKLSSNDVNDLSLRPIVSNTGTATYEIAKYLAIILSSRSKANYKINSTKHFVNHKETKGTR